MNQRRLRNQPSATSPKWLTAQEVATTLDVSVRTVYAYASRGLLGTHRGPGREAVYESAAVERMRTRAAARKGHTAVAAAALHWGAPVLPTALTELTVEGPKYRGVLATGVTERDFEDVARFFWSGVWPDAQTPFFVLPRNERRKTTDKKTNASATLHDELLQTLLALELPRHVQTPTAEWRAGESIVCAFTQLVASAASKNASRPNLRVASQLAQDASLPKSRQEERVLLVNAALVLLLDHELNASTFAARTVAGVGASLVHSIAAGLCALAGPKHGAACERIERFLEGVSAVQVSKRLRETLQLESVEGFFCPPCYPNGDPRAAHLLQMLAQSRYSKRYPLSQAYIRAGAELGLGLPSIDLALVALTESLALNRGMASAIFAIARTAGFVGHSLEQRTMGPIRPRADYFARG